MIKIAIDAMGGDNAPSEIIKGCVEALKEEKCTVQLVLVGKEDVIKKELDKYKVDKSRIEIQDAKDIITMEDSFSAVRTKRDSSMSVGLHLVRDEKVKGIISAGNSGALVAGATSVVGRLRGIKRPVIAPLMPTKKGYSLLVDGGANVDAKPEFLYQFAKIGTVYMQECLHVKNPVVGLVNIGTEEEKGNQLTKEAYKLIKEDKNINFMGNLEAREIPSGVADIVVCDAFVGNVILKFMEGFGNWVFSMMKEEFTRSVKTKIAALLMKSGLKNIKSKFYYNDKGGAPILGLKGLVVKIHGNSKSEEVKGAILQVERFIKTDLVKKISMKFEEEK
ncbi:MAG: phosphate acyltransferase [Candidatus Epulonipiscioides saccharophilum]|nr:MAG: phosphate acyltransferase [Epulopiscium sp. AS2M-Bin001]